MEIFGVLGGLLFWPMALYAWFAFLRKRFSKVPRIAGSILVIAVPALCCLSLGDWMFVQEPLIGAASDGDVPQMKLYLALGASPNVETDEGGNALSFAVMHEHAEAVRVLLVHHANPNVQNPFDHKPILVAAKERGDKEIVRLLRQAGATEESKSQGNER